MTSRYAIFYAPEEGSALADFGDRWLGRNPRTGRSLRQPKVASIPVESMKALTENPRHYGFHATLKPPFRLAEGKSKAALLDAVADFASGTMMWEGPNLVVSTIGTFLALRPSKTAPALDAMAADCVRAFDDFRAPLTDEEVAKRRPDTLTDRQRRNLETWGYPHVMQDFRFHMTLTNSLPSLLRARAQIALVTRFQEMSNSPFCLEALSVFCQADKKSAFRLIGRFPLRSISE